MCLSLSVSIVGEYGGNVGQCGGSGSGRGRRSGNRLWHERLTKLGTDYPRAIAFPLSSSFEPIERLHFSGTGCAISPALH